MFRGPVRSSLNPELKAAIRLLDEGDGFGGEVVNDKVHKAVVVFVLCTAKVRVESAARRDDEGLSVLCHDNRKIIRFYVFCIDNQCFV